MTGFALALNKPTLILFDENIRTDERALSTILLGTMALKRSYLEKYNLDNKADLEKTVQKFLKESSSLIESKFYIILPPEINRYLEWWSYNKRLPKVNKIRELLNKDIGDDKEWQEFIKE